MESFDKKNIAKLTEYINSQKNPGEFLQKLLEQAAKNEKRGEIDG